MAAQVLMRQTGGMLDVGNDQAGVAKMLCTACAVKTGTRSNQHKR